MKRLVSNQISSPLDVNVVWDDLTYRVADTLLFEDSYKQVETLLGLTRAEKMAVKHLRNVRASLSETLTDELAVEVLNLVQSLFSDKIAIMVNDILDGGLIAATFRINHTGYHVYEVELIEKYAVLPASYFDNEVLLTQ